MIDYRRSGNRPAPTLTVIVTVHYRREYVVDAIDSIIHQELSGSPVEIIVVSSLKDSRIEEYASQRGIAFLYEPGLPKGVKIANGLRHSTGELIALLDDDDLMMGGRLKRILWAFRTNPKAIYYHNEYLLISAASNGTVRNPSAAGMSDPGVQLQQRTLRVVDTPVSWAGLLRILSWKGYFSNSCIVVPRRVLEGSLEELSTVRLCSDTALLFLAAAIPGTALIDPTPLTMYRVHPGSATSYPGIVLGVDPAREIAFFDTLIADYLRIAAMRVVRANPRLHRSASALVETQRLLQEILREGTPRADVLRQLRRALRYALSPAFLERVEVIPFAGLFLFSPSATKRMVRIGTNRPITRPRQTQPGAYRL